MGEPTDARETYAKLHANTSGPSHQEPTDRPNLVRDAVVAELADRAARFDALVEAIERRRAIIQQNVDNLGPAQAPVSVESVAEFDRLLEVAGDG